MSKTINFNAPMLDVEGKPVPNKTLANTLAELIGTETEGKTLKLYGWVKELQVGDPLTLDESDEADLKALIENNKRYFIFVKGQLLDAIKGSK